MGIVRVHREARAANVFSSKQDALPVAAAVGGAEDAAVWLRSGGATENAGENDIGIGRVNDDAPDASALGQAHVRPGFAGVGGFINSVACDVTVANHPRLACSCPNRARIRGSNGE